MKSFIVAVLFAVILAAISAQDTDESLKGSETLYLAAPYAAYSGYPYIAAPADAPIAPAAPIAAPVPAPYAAAYYFRR